MKTKRRVGLSTSKQDETVLPVGGGGIVEADETYLAIRTPAAPTERKGRLAVFGDEFSWRDVILIGGGLFLIAKATSRSTARSTSTTILSDPGAGMRTPSSWSY